MIFRKEHYNLNISILIYLYYICISNWDQKYSITVIIIVSVTRLDTKKWVSEILPKPYARNGYLVVVQVQMDFKVGCNFCRDVYAEWINVDYIGTTNS